MYMDLVKQIATLVGAQLQDEFTVEEIEQLLETPKNVELGDVAFPCFTLAKIYKKSPQLIAAELAMQVKGALIAKTEAVGGYVNIFYNQQTVAEQVLEEILKDPNHYGQLPMRNE